jgi:hypothetical protein
MNESHYSQATHQKKLAKDNWAPDFVNKQKSVADQILRQTTQGFSQKHYPKSPTISSDDIMKRITALQAAGYVTNATMTRPSGYDNSTMVLELTPAGIDALVLRDITPELLDTEFLEDQIVEYQDQIPKAFLEGLKAAEGILRGKDFLENYIEAK